MGTGKHLIINARSDNDAIFGSVELVREIIENIVKKLSFTKLSETIVVKGNVLEGVTGFVVIETSHVSVHTFADDKLVAMDVYSCKDFNHEAVLDILEGYGVRDIDMKIIER